MTLGLRHDVPHFAIFHSRNTSGVCPICLVAEASSWADLAGRLREASEITRSEVRRETEERMFSALSSS
jgi:hypothetical protein